jgi:hypothetical protein
MGAAAGPADVLAGRFLASRLLEAAKNHFLYPDLDADRVLLEHRRVP